MPRRDLRYSDAYVWFVFLSALDVMLTWVVLYRGGREANALAAAVLRRFGLRGFVAYKMALVVLVVLICEAVGERDETAGRRLAAGAVALTCVPLIIGVALLVTRL